MHSVAEVATKKKILRLQALARSLLPTLHLSRPNATWLLLLSDSRSQFKNSSDFGEMWRNQLNPTFYNGLILADFTEKKSKNQGEIRISQV
jgi:hypothetical protein